MKTKTRPKVKGKKVKFKALCWYCSKIHCYYPTVPADALHQCHQKPEPKVIEVKPPEKIDIGRLEPEQVSSEGLKKVYAPRGKCPVPFGGTGPAEVLNWCEQVREVHRDRGEFLTVCGLKNYAIHNADYYRKVFATICELYADENRAETERAAAMANRIIKEEVKPEPAAAKPTMTNTAKDVGGIKVEKSESPNGTIRAKVFGMPVTALIRWMAWEAWKEDQVKTALARLDLSVIKDTTIRAQYTSGQKGNKGPHGEIPKLDKKQSASLYALVRVPSANGKKKKKKARK